MSSDDCVCICVLLVVWMRCPILAVTSVWICWVLYSSGLLCVSSHYLIFPRVRSYLVF